MNKFAFLSSVVVLDTETTNLFPEKAEIVELASAKFINGEWQVDSLLMGANKGIPPEASAKNHISNKMIMGLPRFQDQLDKIDEMLGLSYVKYLAAHNSKYDQKVLETAWIHSNLHYQAKLAQDQTKWICTHRLAKKIFNHDFSDMQYNLNYLRYRLDLPVPDDLGSHRAGADTLTCALLLEFLIDYAAETGLVDINADIGAQLHAICWDTIMVKKWPFGKHKGKSLEEIETDYYQWAIANLDALKEDSQSYDKDLAESVAIELEKRLKE